MDTFISQCCRSSPQFEAPHGFVGRFAGIHTPSKHRTLCWTRKLYLCGLGIQKVSTHAYQESFPDQTTALSESVNSISQAQVAIDECGSYLQLRLCTMVARKGGPWKFSPVLLLVTMLGAPVSHETSAAAV